MKQVAHLRRETEKVDVTVDNGVGFSGIILWVVCERFQLRGSKAGPDSPIALRKVFAPKDETKQYMNPFFAEQGSEVCHWVARYPLIFLRTVVHPSLITLSCAIALAEQNMQGSIPFRVAGRSIGVLLHVGLTPWTTTIFSRMHQLDS